MPQAIEQILDERLWIMYLTLSARRRRLLRLTPKEEAFIAQVKEALDGP